MEDYKYIQNRAKFIVLKLHLSEWVSFISRLVQNVLYQHELFQQKREGCSYHTQKLDC